MSETWQDSCPDITSAFTYMMKKEINVDVVFKYGKVPCLYAHKLVLAVWSPYFEDLLRQSNKSSSLYITFNEDVDVMKAILEYIYSYSSSNPFTKMPVEKLIQAMEITERFGMTQVHQKCLLSLHRRKIDPMNVIEFFDYGLRKNLETIVQRCVKVLTGHGLSLRDLNKHISDTTIFALLTLDRIALDSEANLLSVVISWLSHPENKCYKSEALSFVDLLSIEWSEYQSIWKKFPNFFSEAELSAILLGVAQQDATLFPKWYKSKISSTVEKSCDACMIVSKRLNISRRLFAKWNYRRELMDISQTFLFAFDNSSKARLLSVKLNFGPSDIPEKEFVLKFSRSGIGQWKECYLDIARRSNKYVALFYEPLVLKTNDSFTLKFHFMKGLETSKIQVVIPNIIEIRKINEALKKDSLKVELNLSRLAFYCATEETPKYLVSSFCFNFCDQHATRLVRRLIEPQDEKSAVKMQSEYEECIPKIKNKVNSKIMNLDKIKNEDIWDE